MARRSSARLRDRTSTTVTKGVAPSDDASTAYTSQTAPAKLDAVLESDETLGAAATPTLSGLGEVSYPVLPQSLPVSTPVKADPIEPTQKEMHPQLYHQSTAAVRDEARHLGFSNMGPHTEPPKHSTKLATLQGTPSRAQGPVEGANSSRYEFTFRREFSLELSPEAKKLMHEKREEAARIREQMAAAGEKTPSLEQELVSRRIAKPKGRFSQAHLKEFGKMESIAGHPSVLRARLVTSSACSSEREKSSVAKSLKRSPSKAELDQTSSTPTRTSVPRISKPVSAIPGSHVPLWASKKELGMKRPAVEVTTESSAKRVKREENDDVSATRGFYSKPEKPISSTPQGSKTQQSYLPRQAQSARARSKGEILVSSNSVSALKTASAKKPLLSVLKNAALASQGSPALLSKAPTKAPLFANIAELNSKTPYSDTLLTRSPFKPSTKKFEEGDIESVIKTQAPPLLNRSPLKAMAVKTDGDSGSAQKKTASSIPLLGRSPSRMPAVVQGDLTESVEEGSPNRRVGRFNLLRQSPVKSILRSPQRLFSDDPAKVAAGTHLATPPKCAARTNVSASGRKHVDFTSSTKARAEKAESSTPSKTPTRSSETKDKSALSAEAAAIEYPELPDDICLVSPSPQKRRQTSGPSDFTFRAGDQNIIFGQPQQQRASTIRMVSDPIATMASRTGSKKRKFEFENQASTPSRSLVDHTADSKPETASDKENTPDVECRPAKRAKSSVKESAKATTTKSNTRRTTLGVKPKGYTSTCGRPVASPAKPTISQARLAALSQPKRRG